MAPSGPTHSLTGLPTHSVTGQPTHTSRTSGISIRAQFPATPSSPHSPHNATSPQATANGHSHWKRAIERASISTTDDGPVDDISTVVGNDVHAAGHPGAEQDSEMEVQKRLATFKSTAQVINALTHPVHMPRYKVHNLLERAQQILWASCKTTVQRLCLSFLPCRDIFQSLLLLFPHPTRFCCLILVFLSSLLQHFIFQTAVSDMLPKYANSLFYHHNLAFSQSLVNTGTWRRAVLWGSTGCEIALSTDVLLQSAICKM